MTDVQRKIQEQKPEDKKSYCRGLIYAAWLFAIWKDGELLLGSGNITLKEFMNEVEQKKEQNGKSK